MCSGFFMRAARLRGNGGFFFFKKKLHLDKGAARWFASINGN